MICAPNCADGITLIYMRSLARGRELIMETYRIRDEYIKLGQALKASGLAESGVDAKYAVLDGRVKVNGKVEIRRGKKLVPGDVVEYGREILKIEAKEGLQ